MVEHPQAEKGFITPSHYMREGHMQLIDMQEAYLTADEFKGYCKYMITKYILAKRESDKQNMLRAAKKANYYITELISYLTKTTDLKADKSHIEPAYYTEQKIQPIDMAEDFMPFEETVGFYKGTIQRYLYRAPYKGCEFDDFNKIKFYIEHFIAYLEKIIQKENK